LLESPLRPIWLDFIIVLRDLRQSPAPKRKTSCGLKRASSLMASLPLRGPFDCGVKVM